MLKHLLNIKSFSEIVGIKQPSETCPMIDKEIDSLKDLIENNQNEISSLNSDISNEENEEYPDSRQIDSLKNQIDKLESEISSAEREIESLEYDRGVVRDIRSQGIANRSYVLDSLDKHFVENSGKTYLFTKELNIERASIGSVHAPSLKTSYKSIDSNHSALTDWATTWSEAIGVFLDALPNSIIQVNLSLSEQDDLPVLRGIIIHHDT